MKKNLLISGMLSLMILAGTGRLCLAGEDQPIGDDAQIAAAENQVLLTLNFKDASVESVLDYLSKTAGLIIVSDQYIEDRITVISRKPLDIDQTVGLINTVLKEKGFAAIRMGRTLKLVSLDQAAKLNIPVTVGNDPAKIEPTDEVVTHVIPVVYASAAKLQNNLAALLPEYASISANEETNMLIVTDTKANIRRLVEIVSALDNTKVAVADVRVFHLSYADADNTADLINEIFKEDQSSDSSTRQFNPFSRMPGFRGRGPERDSDRNSGSNDDSRGIKVVASADDRTNSVVVSGPAETLKVIADVIAKLDANPADERSIFIYRLKNAQCDNLKERLNNLFSEMEEMNDDSSGRSSSQRTFGRQTGSGNTSSSDDISDQVYFEADEDTNSLIILTSPKNYEKVKPIIEELDRPVEQVLIKVLIAEVTHSDMVDLGTEFSNINLHSGGPDQTTISTEFPFTSATEGFTFNTLQGDLDVTLRAMEQVGKLNVLSRPYILTSNNQTATITVGEETPFITDTRITETGQTINTIEYQDIGIILEVTPYINPEGLVIMDVKPEISSVGTREVQITEGVSAQVYAKRSSESRVAVNDAQTIVIGGLIKDDVKETVNKVPLLGDLPLLGGLFRRTRTEKAKTELLIFLTPHVATKAEVIRKITDDERNRSKLLDKSVEPGLFNEYMENMKH